MFKWIVEPFIEIYGSLRSNKSEGILWVWFITFLWILSVIYFWSSPKGLNLNLVGDAMWWIFGTLISTIVLIFVIESYRLQKEELKKTTEALEGQEWAMNEQRFQDHFFRLIELFNSNKRKLVYKYSYNESLERFSFEDILSKLLEWIINWRLGSQSFTWSDFKFSNDIGNEDDTLERRYINLFNRIDGQITKNQILQYMKLLSQIHKTIEFSWLEENRKEDFRDILESILSKEEKELIEIHRRSWLEPVISFL